MPSINGMPSAEGEDGEAELAGLHRCLPGLVVLALIAAYLIQNRSSQMVEVAEGLSISRWMVAVLVVGGALLMALLSGVRLLDEISEEDRTDLG